MKIKMLGFSGNGQCATMSLLTFRISVGQIAFLFQRNAHGNAVHLLPFSEHLIYVISGHIKILNFLSFVTDEVSRFFSLPFNIFIEEYILYVEIPFSNNKCWQWLCTSVYAILTSLIPLTTARSHPRLDGRF